MKAYQTSERRFGVEFEVIPDRYHSVDEIKEVLKEAGFHITSTGYGHTSDKHRYWTIKPDGSLTRGGFEIVSPILKGAAGLAAVEKMAQILSQYCHADGSCGFHVHHEAVDFDGSKLKAVYRAYQAVQIALELEVLDDSRIRNTYCKPLPIGTLITESIRRLDRYHAVNFRAFSSFGTLEFRQYQGTVNAAKALAWVIFTQALMEYALAVKTISVSPSKKFKNVVENRLYLTGENLKKVMVLADKQQ